MCNQGLSAYSGVLEPYQICFLGHFHVPVHPPQPFTRDNHQAGLRVPQIDSGAMAQSVSKKTYPMFRSNSFFDWDQSCAVFDVVLPDLAAGIAVPAPEGFGAWAAVFGASNCHIRVGMLLGRADLHTPVRRVNLFRVRRFAGDHIEIPVAACVVAAAVRRCAFKNILPKQRRRVG